MKKLKIFNYKNIDDYKNILFLDCDIIPYVANNTAWANLTTGAWCWYNNDPELGKIYGKLYNWYLI